MILDEIDIGLPSAPKHPTIECDASIVRSLKTLYMHAFAGIKTTVQCAISHSD